MSLVDWAKKELELVGMPVDGNPDDMNTAMAKHLIHMVQEFANEGHSGFSASYAAKALNSLFTRKPLSALTGEDSEWEDVSAMHGSPLWQNKRCGRVFKDEKEAYDIEGRVFFKYVLSDTPGEPPTKQFFTSNLSKVVVTFPYVVKTEVLPGEPAAELNDAAPET